MARVQEFGIGEVVKVVEGGWGISPLSVGIYVRIAGWDCHSGMYSIKPTSQIPAAYYTNFHISARSFAHATFAELSANNDKSYNIKIQNGDTTTIEISGNLTKAQIQGILSFLYDAQ